MAAKIIRTICPRAGYGSDVILAHVENGRLVKVEGDPKDRVARGLLTPFARRYVERTYSEERITTPLKRVGPVGSREFEPITWDEAISTLAAKLARVARDQDPRAVFHYAGNGHDGVLAQFSNLFFGYYGGYSTVYGDLCNAAGMEATRLTFGTLMHHPPEDYVNCGLILIWGKNPAVTNPHMIPYLEAAQKAGAKLICVDPLRTKTAEMCDEHISLRPGTDGFFANAVGHVLIEEGLHDQSFVAKHVHGFEDYRGLVRQCEPKKAEEICGIPAERLVDFARRYGSTRPVNVNLGFGAQRYRNAGQTVRAIAALQALTGNIGVPGGGFDYFNQSAFVTRPYPFKIPAPPRVRQLGPASQFGRVLLGADEPPILAAIIERANPMSQNPFASAVHYALTRLEFVCVIDQFLTDTARRADLVLPAKSMFEELDIVPGRWDGILRLKRPCIDSPGEVRTEREIYRALAVALGYPTDQFELDPTEVLNRVLPPGLSVKRLSRQDFDRRGPKHVPFADRKFPTPSGKIEVKCEAAEVSWRVDPLPFYSPPRESQQNDHERFKRFPLHLITPKTEDRHLSQWAHDDTLDSASVNVARMNPKDAAKRKLKSGDPVRVYNDRGEVVFPLAIDDGVREGVVVLPQGRWVSKDGATVNVLTHDDVTDMGYGAIYYDCLVQAEKPKK